MYERGSNSQGGIYREENSELTARMKKDQYVIIECINALMDSILTQPGVSSFISEKRELREAFTNTDRVSTLSSA